MLTKALGPLDSALNRLADAKKIKGLAKRVDGAGSAATEAASVLGPVTPPAEVADGHAALVTALEEFGADLNSLGTEVGERAICTGSAVRARLGDGDGTSALRKALATVSRAAGRSARTETAGRRSET